MFHVIFRQNASNTLNSEVSFCLHWFFFGKKVALCSQCKGFTTCSIAKTHIPNVSNKGIQTSNRIFYSIPHPEGRQNGIFRNACVVTSDRTCPFNRNLHFTQSRILPLVPFLIFGSQLLDHLSFFHSFQSFPELPPEFHSFFPELPLQSFPVALETLQSWDPPLQSLPPEVPDQSLSCSWKNIQVLLHNVESGYIITYIITTHSIYQYIYISIYIIYHISYLISHISNIIYHISYIIYHKSCIYIYLVHEHTDVYIYMHMLHVSIYLYVYVYIHDMHVIL